MLFYIPLERYEERYTSQLSRPITGWWERNWRQAGIEYRRIDSSYTNDDYASINTGVVLDAARRSLHAMEQTQQILRLLLLGAINEQDTLYFDDFWHPGLESIRYYMDLKRMKGPKLYSFMWAQSVDQYDFTRVMLPWIRDVEKAYSKIYDTMFVASSMLRNMAAQQLCMVGKFAKVGLPFSSEEVLEYAGPDLKAGWNREYDVAFTSRWDWEKSPETFVDVMEAVLTKRPETKIAIVTGRRRLTNDPYRLKLAEDFASKYPSNVTVFLGRTKKEYYDILKNTKIQMNTALQDWVSYTLLEAVTLGCIPVYPNFRSFPEAMGLGTSQYLYGTPFKMPIGNSHVYPQVAKDAAAEKVLSFLDPTVLQEEGNSAAWSRRMKQIVSYHDNTWSRIADAMKVKPDAAAD